MSDGSKSGDPAMMIGEKVRVHEGDHWLGRGRLRWWVVSFTCLLLLTSPFSFVTAMSRVA